MSVTVYCEVCNLGNTKWIDTGYKLTATSYIKVFDILTKITILLCTISVLVFVSLCPAFECDVLKALFVKSFSTP